MELLSKKGLFCLLIIASTHLYGETVKQHKLHCVILAGGDGTRLWPLSRRSKPKQLLQLGSDATLLEQTLDRVAMLVPKEQIWVSSTAHHERALYEMVNDRIGHMIVEPSARNTGPSILLCCMEIYRIDPDAVILFLPADAFIPKRDWNKCKEFLEHAADCAVNSNEIVLLGAKPTYPSTAYGYIEYNPQQKEHQGAYKVSRFREKPSVELAEHYIEQGNNLWNIGIFCAKASIFIEEFKLTAPTMFAGVERYLNHEDQYQSVVSDSIDYAVMEKSKKVLVLPVDFCWCDVGNIEKFLFLKQQSNMLDANFISVDAHNNLIDVPGKLVALIGVDDLCVVEVEDVLLVTKRKSSDEVRRIIKLLKQRGYTEHL